MEIKKDCFAYNNKKDECNALKKLYCKSEKCSFYNNKVDARELEISVTKYFYKK